MVVDISRFPQKNENKNVKRKITQDATLFKTFYRRKKILKRKKENMNVPREVTPLQLDTSSGLFTWSGGPRSSGAGFFCVHALRDTKQKKPTPLDRGPPLHVNRVLI